MLIGTDRTQHWCRSTLYRIISKNLDYQRQNQFLKTIYHNIKVSHHTILITSSKINFEKVHTKFKSIGRVLNKYTHMHKSNMQMKSYYTYIHNTQIKQTD